MDPWRRQLEGAPISATERAELLRWERIAFLSRAADRRRRDIATARTPSRSKITSSRAYNISRETVRKFLSPVEGGGYGLGPDVLSAYCNYAIENQFPEDGDDTLGDQMFSRRQRWIRATDGEDAHPDAFAGPRTVDAVWRIASTSARSIARANRPGFG